MSASSPDSRNHKLALLWMQLGLPVEYRYDFWPNDHPWWTALDVIPEIDSWRDLIERSGHELRFRLPPQ